jgi:hypothetical protein
MALPANAFFVAEPTEYDDIFETMRQQCKTGNMDEFEFMFEQLTDGYNSEQVIQVIDACIEESILSNKLSSMDEIYRVCTESHLAISEFFKKMRYLRMSIEKGTDEITKRMLSWPVYEECKRHAPLWAVRYEREGLFLWMKQNGYDMSINDVMCPSLLCYAIKRQSIKMIDFLLQNGFSINERDERERTPLMHAATLTYGPEIVSHLISLGAHVNDVDIIGKTAFDLANERHSHMNAVCIRCAPQYDCDIKQVVRVFEGVH